MTTPNEFAEQAGLGMWQAYCDKKQQVEALQEEIERLTGEAVAADIRIANDALVIAGLTAERDAPKAERADLLGLALQAKRHHDKVVAERDAARADALRYRWLCENGDADGGLFIGTGRNGTWGECGHSAYRCKERADAAIDKAIRESNHELR